MTAPGALSGAIIAAGHGSRLRRAGWTVPKPLVPVAGVPLIEHAIGHFVAASVTSLAIIVNEDARETVDRVRRRFPALELRIVVKTTASSLESFREVTAGLEAEQVLVSTVDAWCPDVEFVRFVRAAGAHGPAATVLGLTALVADERPLWAHVEADGRVRRLGGDPAPLVTAGFYLVPRHVTRMTIPPALGRLREFLGWLVERGEPVYGVSVPGVVDVDRADDVALAEALARSAG